MLKGIELHGFKSFADRTRLEFGEGISAVVGPNGSGKSNVVDAIKWVLGEQSVKKLRGSEMTDVIFSGSASRQSVGAAEVSLIFDNSAKIFDLETAEVQITRRILRSGEGEYLINRQPVRLKDVKDVLGGTGLGSQAYSIIEQGRVESLLQSSPIQRRVIFDEAAGITRFNAKKQEIQRRLERVDQNLIRLSDKVGEVENQLKMIKSQAGKAQLHRQYTTRLQELRIKSGISHWKKSTARISALLEEIETLSTAEKEAIELVEQLEKSVGEHNAFIEETNRQIGRIEGDVVAVQERISGEESTIEIQAEQVSQAESEILRLGCQLLELNVKSGDTEEMMRKTDDEIRKAKKFHAEIEISYQQCLELTETLAAECEQNQAQYDLLRNELEERNRKISRMSGELGGLGARVQSLTESRDKNVAQLQSFETQRRQITGQLEENNLTCSEIAENIEQGKVIIETLKNRKKRRLETINEQTQELFGYKQRLSGMTERVSVLEELLRKHEGLSPDAKSILQQPRGPNSPYQFVHGLVAELFRVEVEAAPLIELALGPKAQYIVVTPEPELIKLIERPRHQLTGRVEYMLLDTVSQPAPWIPGNGFDGRKGVLGRADRFIQTETFYAHLAQHLLGKTWIVENLTVAKMLYRESDDRTNFLTRSGEYLTGDGCLVLGPSSGVSGVITRRSELRTVVEQLQIVEEAVREKEISITVLKNRLNEDEQEIETATKEQQKIVSELESKKQVLQTLEEQLKNVDLQREQLQAEIAEIELQLEKAQADLDNAQSELAEMENDANATETKSIELRNTKEEREQARKEHAKKTTNVKIELARSEERLDSLKERIRQFEDRQMERQTLLDERRNRVKILEDRRDQASLAILKLESSLALLYVRKETLTDSVKTLLHDRVKTDERRNHAQSDLKKGQQEYNRIRGNIHTKQSERDRLEQEQKTLADRMRDDFEIEIDEAAEDEKWSDGDEKLIDETDISKEIDELRSKIQRMGGVNMDAIETLEELEKRFTSYSSQYNDMTNAKKMIEKTIEQVNVESQRMFEETFEGVRQYFQQLFQQLFGGGHADLKLEDEMSILESGVEIVARPPGKDLKSVSLLSGGEKTLTCVALLLAFFQFKPNPVCILDEVDAALDEGNIDRFARVIGDFRTKTQFIIITHSKKTMACASTLYGITMQDSGVSKPISVRFVDVGENGEILDGAGSQCEPPDNVFSIDSPSPRNEAA